jgi:uncharacterized protein (DUF1684 family)
MTGVMPAEAREDARTRFLLADWRRRVSALYVEVRRLAETDPGAALAQWRAVRERLYREHPQSPVPAERRAGFAARHFPHDPALRFEVAVAPDPAGAGEAAGRDDLQRVGWVQVPFAAGTRRLALFWLPGYVGGLFLPFRDATNGAETYGGGRYLLDGAKSADLGGDPARGTLILDFNFAYHPSCAFDPRWPCPLAPPENWLDIPIRAGEQLAG